MLFCFGLFALLLYYTVVANAECSYAYWNSSRRIEAYSVEFESQGFHRCEFLIHAVSGQHYIDLSFTNITGFEESSSMHGGSTEEDKEEKNATKEGYVDGTTPGMEDFKRRGGEQAQADTSTRNHHLPHAHHSSSATSTVHPGPSNRHHSIKPFQATSQPSEVSSTSPILKTREESSAKSSESVHSDPVGNDSKTLETGVQPPGSKPVQGNVTKIHCLPKVEIREVLEEGVEKTRSVICSQRQKYRAPIVFQYASTVRIVYIWEQDRRSGFTLNFYFSQEKCVFKCDDGRCLADLKVLCNEHSDCVDQTDELHPSCHRSASSTVAEDDSDTDPEDLMMIVAVPICAVILIALCVVFLTVRYRCSLLSCIGHDHSSRTAHLTGPQSQCSEGFTPSAGSLQECSEQAVALLHNGHSQKTWSPPQPSRSVPDSEVFLPPNIPVSPDGEEGYPASQVRLLHPQYRMAQSELFKAPPNKTVFDRESPPPYSLHHSPRGVGHGSVSFPPSLIGNRGKFQSVRIMRDSQGHPMVSRCYSMSTPSPSGIGVAPNGSGPGHPRLHPPHPFGGHPAHGAFSVVNSALCLPPLFESSTNGVQSCVTHFRDAPPNRACDDYSVSAKGGGAFGDSSSDIGAPPSYEMAFSDTSSLVDSASRPSSSGV